MWLMHFLFLSFFVYSNILKFEYRLLRGVLKQPCSFNSLFFRLLIMCFCSENLALHMSLYAKHSEPINLNRIPSAWFNKEEKKCYGVSDRLLYVQTMQKLGTHNSEEAGNNANGRVRCLRYSQVNVAKYFYYLLSLPGDSLNINKCNIIGI